MNCSYDLWLAGIRLRILAPRELHFPDCYIPFVTETCFPELTEDAPADWLIEVHFGTEAYTPSEGDRITRFPRKSGDDFLRVLPIDRGNTCRFFVPSDMADSFVRHANWTLFLMPEQLLLPYDRVFLHASVVMHEGEAILFTAPSGGGKSTQAALWERMFGSEIINGDKAVLSTSEDPIMAYGSPIAGSSRLYKNQRAPVKAIVYIKKGTQNQIVRLDARRAFMALYSQMIKSVDDTVFNNTLLAHIAKIVEKTMILEYTCIPEPSAATELHAWLSSFSSDI